MTLRPMAGLHRRRGLELHDDELPERHLGFGRIVASEKEVPIILVNLV